MICLACGEEHNILETLKPECLAVAKVATEEEILKAFEKGNEDYKKWRQLQPTMPGFFL